MKYKKMAALAAFVLFSVLVGCSDSVTKPENGLAQITLSLQDKGQEVVLTWTTEDLESGTVKLIFRNGLADTPLGTGTLAGTLTVPARPESGTYIAEIELDDARKISDSAFVSRCKKRDLTSWPCSIDELLDKVDGSRGYIATYKKPGGLKGTYDISMNRKDRRIVVKRTDSGNEKTENIAVFERSADQLGNAVLLSEQDCHVSIGRAISRLEAS